MEDVAGIYSGKFQQLSVLLVGGIVQGSGIPGCAQSDADERLKMCEDAIEEIQEQKQDKKKSNACYPGSAYDLSRRPRPVGIRYGIPF